MKRINSSYSSADYHWYASLAEAITEHEHDPSRGETWHIDPRTPFRCTLSNPVVVVDQYGETQLVLPSTH